MFKASDIALWFIYKTSTEIKENVVENDEYEVYEGLTHPKLQKLLYYAQGVTLSIMNKEKLFDEKIIAWEHGPVVQEVYNIYKNYGRKNLEVLSNKDNDDIISNIENNSKISNILNLVYDNFAIYTAWHLKNMTQKAGSPWDITVQNKGLNSEIQVELIKDYFDKYVVE